MNTALAFQPPDELGLIVLGYVVIALIALVALLRTEHGDG